MDLSNNQISKKQKSNQDDENIDQYDKDDLEQDDQTVDPDDQTVDPDDQDEQNVDPDDQDEQNVDQDDKDVLDEQYDQDETYEPKYENVDLLDSIAIARETYFFTYMDSEDEINTVNERNVLKFIYEQIANTYSDVSLLEILGHIRHYYNLTFPEHERLVALFYLSVYPQALMTDRMSAGFIRTNSQGNEVIDSYIQVSNSNLNSSSSFANLFHNLINTSNLINPDISFNIINDLNNESHLLASNSNTIRNNLDNSRGNSSLLTEIMFLSTIFNMRSNDSLLHVLNLMNNILERSEGDKETASKESIKELSAQVYSTIGLDHKEKNSDFCTICQENYSDDSQLKILPCGHFFHCDCIEPWLLNCSNLCPICRKKI